MGSSTLAVTDTDFATTVLGASQPALVDFWAEWCKPCLRLAPAVEQVAETYAGRAVVVKLDVQNNPETAVKYRVQSIPTLLFIKNGQEVDRIVGLTDAATIARRLDALLG
jgi:thioredoxin 1